MVNIGSVSSIGEKWSRRASGAGQDYQQGVEDSSDEEWSSATIDSEGAWSQGVQEAASEGRFASGVRNTNKSWQERAATLGPNRYAEGVRESQSEYEAGFSPYADVISDTDLPARGPRGDIATNMERSRIMAERLADRRRQG